MFIQLNTDKNLEGKEALELYVEEELLAKLGRFEDRVTRIIVNMGDYNAVKHGPKDKYCSLEARPASLDPINVTNEADNIHDAIKGAIERLERVLRKTFDKRDEVRPRKSPKA